MRPGVVCSKVFAVWNGVTKKNGIPERIVGRSGHWSNQSGNSIHPDCHLILEPGVVTSCELTFVAKFGYFDVQDIVLITRDGCERLHKSVPEDIPCCS